MYTLKYENGQLWGVYEDGSLEEFGIFFQVDGPESTMVQLDGQPPEGWSHVFNSESEAMAFLSENTCALSMRELALALCLRAKGSSLKEASATFSVTYQILVAEDLTEGLKKAYDAAKKHNNSEGWYVLNLLEKASAASRGFEQLIH